MVSGTATREMFMRLFFGTDTDKKMRTAAAVQYQVIFEVWGRFRNCAAKVAGGGKKSMTELMTLHFEINPQRLVPSVLCRTRFGQWQLADVENSTELVLPLFHIHPPIVSFD